MLKRGASAGAYRAMPMPNFADRSAPRLNGEPTLEEARLRQQAIGVKLRQMFDTVVNEPIPDDFLDILRRADQKGSEAKGAGTGDD